MSRKPPLADGQATANPVATRGITLHVSSGAFSHAKLQAET